MSVKAQALVWDLECPKMYGPIAFKPSHKYTLIAYADHADHTGKNIFPAVPTIARKTGLDDRTVQRITHDLEEIGLLVEDGTGPRGTNRWRLPYSERGDKLSPVTKCRGDENGKSLGDIPSGDIPSGDKLTPELKEPEPLIKDPIQEAWGAVQESLKSQMKSSLFDEYVRPSRVVGLEEGTLVIGVKNADAREWLEDRVTATAERLLIGITARALDVMFVVEAQ